MVIRSSHLSPLHPETLNSYRSLHPQGPNTQCAKPVKPQQPNPHCTLILAKELFKGARSGPLILWWFERLAATLPATPGGAAKVSCDRLRAPAVCKSDEHTRRGQGWVVQRATALAGCRPRRGEACWRVMDSNFGSRTWGRRHKFAAAVLYPLRKERHRWHSGPVASINQFSTQGA